MSDNLALWNSVVKTDPSYTKPFNRAGGFRGTAINATYLAKRATETFGPIGIGWGFDVVDEQIIQGTPIFADGTVIANELIHKVRIKLWYLWDDFKGEVTQFGQTLFVGQNKNGIFTDEEAPKKSMTDAVTKCLSLLGFAADVHLGLFDDNKYVADLKREIANGNGNGTALKEKAKKLFEHLVTEGPDKIREVYLSLEKEEKREIHPYAKPYLDKATLLAKENTNGR